MSKPVAAYKRNGSIALVFADGNANQFTPWKGTDAVMSIVCFDGRQQGWTEIPVEDGIRAAEACGFEFED